MTLAVAFSATALVLLTAVHWYRGRRGAGQIAATAALVVYLGVLHFSFGFPSPPVGIAKGPADSDTGPLVLALFVFMTLGMAAEYLYRYLDAKPEESKFDWKTFAKPFLVSPLVFVPLAASLQNAKVDLASFNIPLLMLFLVAFENGFLWRGYFTRRMQSASEG
jgi:hypothetical protein